MSTNTQFQPANSTVTIQAAQNLKITNLALILSGTEYSLALQANCKEILIRCRETADLQIAFISGDSGTTYLSIPRLTTLNIDDVDLLSSTIYLQSNKAAATAEILEKY